MKTVIVIPSRYGSSRLPGKPLAEIKGHSLIRRVWSIAKAVENVEAVVVATDDDRIYDHCQSFGAEAMMTPESCRNGTERVYSATRGLSEKPEIVINLQGDAVLTPPWIISAVIDSMINNPDIEIATPAVQLTWERYDNLKTQKVNGLTTGTLAVFDKNFNALYFSKNMIPNIRNRITSNQDELSPGWLHIGLYGYRYKALEKYLTFEPTKLEQAEQLEQLRALENGMKVRVVPVDYKGKSSWSIDNSEDITRVEEIIDREGELVL